MQRFAHYAASRARQSHERRTRERAPLVVSAQVAHNGVIVKQPTFDISEGGLRMATDKFNINSVVKVFVPIPSASHHKARMCVMRAVVVWSENGSCGLQFIDPPIDTLLQVRDYIQDQAAAA